MKKFLLVSLFFTFALLSPLTLVRSVAAKVIYSQETVTVTEGEVIDDDLFISASTINIEGTVNGDVYAAGGIISITGTINGDLLAAGGTIEISGTVSDDVRVTGGLVDFKNASVGSNVNIGAGTVTLDPETEIGGSVIVGSGTLSMSAQVGRHLIVGTGTANINGTIGKNLYAASENIVLGADTVIGGDFHYLAESEALVNEGSKIAGITGRVTQPVTESMEVGSIKDWRNALKRLSWTFRLMSYLSTLLVGIILMRFFREPSERIVNIMRDKPWASLGWGFAVLFLSVPVLFLIAVTGIGLSLAFILGILLTVEIYLTKVIAGLLLGQAAVSLLGISKEETGSRNLNIYLVLAIGLIVYYLLTMIPLLNFFIVTGTLVFGLGAMFLFKKDVLSSSLSTEANSEK